MTHVKQYFYHPEFSWARVVSDIISPPVVWAVMVLPVALHYSTTTGQALGWALIYSLFVSLLPIVFVAVMVARGKIGDMHMKERHERYLPFLVSIGCTLIAFALLLVLNAPPALPLLAIISVVNIAVIALITLMWQISMHAMSISSATIAVGVIFSIGTALLLVPLVVLVGIARLRLKRHTPAQVVAGTLIGAIVPMLVLIALGMML
jgi:membrane-associated phospholipid phosphatase